MLFNAINPKMVISPFWFYKKEWRTAKEKGGYYDNRA